MGNVCVRVGEPEDGRGPYVGDLPVPGVRRPPQNPHRHDDQHLQEDIRQPGHPVEVSQTDSHQTQRDK